jgi:hypothetical protein
VLLGQAGDLVLKVSDPGVLLFDQPSPRIGGVRSAVCAVIPQFSHDLTLGNLGREDPAPTQNQGCQPPGNSKSPWYFEKYFTSTS